MRDVIYHDRPRETTAHKAAKWTAGIVCAAAVVCCGALMMGRMELDMSRQAIESLRQNVLEAAVQCYAIEGSYPTGMDYLEMNYGVRYNAARYEVTLNSEAPDKLPEVSVNLR